MRAGPGQGCVSPAARLSKSLAGSHRGHTIRATQAGSVTWDTTSLLNLNVSMTAPSRSESLAKLRGHLGGPRPGRRPADSDSETVTQGTGSDKFVRARDSESESW